MVEVCDGNRPTVVLHDGSFEGFLSGVFEATRLRLRVEAMVATSRHVPGLLETVRPVDADPERAERVWNGLLARCGQEVAAMVRCAFQSEIEGMDTVLWRYLAGIFSSRDGSVARNVLDSDAFAVLQAAQKVRHEVHRFHGFVRFSKAPDGTLFSLIFPDHDILEMLASHFLARYPNETWLIADSRRGLCLHGEAGRVRTARCDPSLLPKTVKEAEKLSQGGDEWIQRLWLTYYDAVNIQERRNTRQMVRCLPRKYWGYLPERNVARWDAGSWGGHSPKAF